MVTSVTSVTLVAVVASVTLVTMVGTVPGPRGRVASTRRLPPTGCACSIWWSKILIAPNRLAPRDRKSTRLNSSHVESSYAVFCLKRKRRGARHWRFTCCHSHQVPQPRTRPYGARRREDRRAPRPCRRNEPPPTGLVTLPLHDALPSRRGPHS